MIYHHDLNPVAFSVGHIPVSWYWLVYLLGYFFILHRGKRILRLTPSLGLPAERFSRHMLWSWYGLFLGSRLWYVAFYHPKYFMEYPNQIYQFWNGGMSFHGALVGITAALFFSTRKHRGDFWTSADLIALSIPLVLAAGRVTNFLNGELAGRPTDGTWGVVFPRYVDDSPRHPSQLYQALTEGILLFALLQIKSIKRLSARGSIACFFITGYGLMRFFTEFFRQPDPQIGFLALGLSVGQLYCALMVLSGVWLYRKLRVQHVSS